MTRLAVMALCVVFSGTGLSAQGVSSVTLGFGVDPNVPAWSEVGWHDSVSEIYDAWREYLLSDPHLQSPTPLWSAQEQERWPSYDLTAGAAYVGGRATVVDIRPVGTAESEEFVVRTLFAHVDREGAVRPVALTRVFAVREDGQWVFSSAIHRLTRGWQEERVGPISFRFGPSYAFDRERAEGAVAFADSLAVALDLPRIEDVTYFVADSPEELTRIMGVDWTFGGMGYGYALAWIGPADTWKGLVLSGDPVFGEENRHELTHMAIAPILAGGRTHRLVNEGLATWLGGSVGMHFEEVARTYSSYLAQNPEISLDDVLAGEGPDRGMAPAGALLVRMVYEARGVDGLKELLTGGRSNDELRETLRSLLEMECAEINERWRESVETRNHEAG